MAKTTPIQPDDTPIYTQLVEESIAKETYDLIFGPDAE